LVDAVAVLTLTISYAEIGVAAISSGKHVIIEKPPALTLQECDKLTERAACSKIRGMVGFNHRWHRLIHRAEKLFKVVRWEK
jgi:predicted dehydrogenase